MANPKIEKTSLSINVITSARLYFINRGDYPNLLYRLPMSIPAEVVSEYSAKRQIHVAAPSLEQKWPEIAGCGYTIQPFLDSVEVEALIDLHRATNAVVPSDFYHSAFGSTEARLRIDDGIQSIVKTRVERLFTGYRILTSSFVTKKAWSTQGKLPVHQDASVVDQDKNLALNVWVPLCDVDERNACLRMVAYSQRFRHVCAIPLNPAPYSDLLYELESNYLTDVPMTSGNACIFDSRVLHASDENCTPRDRIAMQLTLVPLDVLPRLYFWNSEVPFRLEVYNVDREFLTNLNVRQFPSEAEKMGASFVGIIDYIPASWSVAELAERIPRAKANSIGNQTRPRKSGRVSGRRSWLRNVFTFRSR